MKPPIKKRIKQQAFNLTKEILLWLLEMPGGLAKVFLDSPKGYASQFYPDKQITLNQIKRSLHDLENQRLIRKKQNRQNIIYEVTDLGKAKALKWRYKRMAKQMRRDGFGTIVIFDIPESKKKARDFLRRFLRDNEFTQIQESVFISRFYLLEEFDSLLDELNIGQYVSVLEGRIMHQ